MEMIKTQNNNANLVFEKEDLINILNQINISAFLDRWGPNEIIQVYDPEINMQGILAIDNTTLGPGLGCIKISPSITPRQIFQYARKMTLTCALMGINFGGAATGIKANPSEIDKKKYIKSLARKISPYIPSKYIAAPDINIGQEEIAAFVEEVGDLRGATGKPENMKGIPYEIGIIGFGLGVAIETAIKIFQSSSSLPSDLSNTKIAIQGFDIVGSTLAKFLNNKGAKIVALSDPWCTIYDSKGIDIIKVLEYSSAINEKHSLKNYKTVKSLAKNDIIKVDCDIFIPTLENNVLTNEDIPSLKTKLIVEGFTNSINSIDEMILYRKGILVLPDILTMASGAISSYIEYNGGSNEEAFSTIESRIQEATKQIIQSSMESHIPLRRIAKEIAKEKILDAMEVVH